LDRGKGLSSKKRAIFRRQKNFVVVRDFKKFIFGSLHFSLAIEWRQKDDAFQIRGTGAANNDV
jgi:hypothetical protein